MAEMNVTLNGKTITQESTADIFAKIVTTANPLAITPFKALMVNGKQQAEAFVNALAQLDPNLPVVVYADGEAQNEPVGVGIIAKRAELCINRDAYHITQLGKTAKTTKEAGELVTDFSFAM